MKKTIIIFAVGVSLAIVACNNTRKTNVSTNKETNNEKYNIDKENSEYPLDWAGIYEGQIQGYEGNIKVSIELKNDNTYEISEFYDQKEHTNSGKFEWMQNNNVIKLSEAKFYKIEANKLIMLNPEAKEIKVEGANYALVKVGVSEKSQSKKIKNISWKEMKAEIKKGKYSAIYQSHNKELSLTSNDGIIYKATQPNIDDYLKVVEECKDCPEIPIATE